MGAERRRVAILGVLIDDITLAEAVARVIAWTATATPHLVVTPNPEFVMVARRDTAFRELLNEAALAVPDGVGLLWAARWLGQPLRGRVPGIDLVEALAAAAAARRQRWFLLGARDGVAAAAGRVLSQRYPGLTIAGTLAGEPDPAGDGVAQAAIAAAQPIDLLLVAYGAPRQERWLARNLPTLGVPVGIGVGGAFNYLAGVSRRPPRWLRRAGLEWLFRLVTEPWRWRRQAVLPLYLLLVGLAALRQRLSARG